MTDFGDGLIEAMQEAAAYVRGDIGETTTTTVDVLCSVSATPKIQKIDSSEIDAR
jgi:hypothetical protein